MKSYLVTGGAGFIGSNYIHYLMKCYGEHIRITNLDALTYCGKRSNTAMYEICNNYTFIKGNICDEEFVKKLFHDYDFDYVIHFAEQIHVDLEIVLSDAGIFCCVK